VTINFDASKAVNAVYLAERADHVNTPAAGSAELWVSNDATQKLYFTNDAGTDNEVAFLGGGSDLSAFTGILGLNSGTAVDVNTSALLAARISDETGSGSLVFATSPTLTEPLIQHGYNAQTGTTYTLVAGDQSAVITMSNASANTLTIPTNSSVAFPIGTVILIYMLGAGTTTITGDTGVTVTLRIAG